jgi:AcrR family transcriptional regulator
MTLRPGQMTGTGAVVTVGVEAWAYRGISSAWGIDLERPEVTGSRPAATRHRPTEDQILDAACSVFAAEGFAQANMETIAARAGTTKPTLYARFGAKEQLFVTVLRREHELLNSWVAAEYQAGTGEPFRKRLHHWVAMYFNFVRERPDGFRLTFEGERHAAGAAAVETAMDERIDAIARLVSEMSGRPAGSSGPRVVAAAIVGLLRWCAREAIRDPRLDIDAVAALSESMVYSMMRALDAEVMDQVTATVAAPGSPGAATA